jgi:6-phosphogluconolactonase (cycloisomerase 2 family)
VRAGKAVDWRLAARRISVVGALTVIALIAGACGRGIFSGTSSSSSSGSGGGATARSVYVTNFADGKVSAISRNSSGGALSHPVTIAAGPGAGPVGLAIKPATLNALYAANSADNKIHEFAIDTNGNLSALGTIAAGKLPQQPVVTPTGTFVYSANSGGSISEYLVDSTTGALSANTTASTSSGPLVTPISAVATDTFLYLTDLNGGAGVVWTFTINADGTLAAGPSSTPSLGLPIGKPAIPGQIIMDLTATFVFVSDASGNVSVLQVSGSSLAFVMAVATSAGSQAAGLAYATVGGINYLYCANPAANSVSVFTFDNLTGVLTFLSTSLDPSLNQPTGLAVNLPATAGFLYVTNAGNGTVTQFTISQVDGSLSTPVATATQNPANTSSAPTSILITG